MRTDSLASIVVSAWLLAACGAPGPRGTGAREVAVQVIPLAGPARSSSAQFSGMAWYGDQLILLPQFPDHFASAHDGALLAIPEASLHAGLAAGAEPIVPRTIDLVAPGLFEQVADMQGLEAIAFWGDRVFVTIEAGRSDQMTGYLAAGTIAPDLSRITLDTSRLIRIPARAPILNASEETLVVDQERVLTFFEANGANVNPSPVAHVFDHELRPQGTVPFARIEYRVIDATALDARRRFWVSNYLFTGDRETYDPAPDPIAAAHGTGASHRSSGTVERLIQLELEDDGVRLVDREPIQLRLGAEGRNWEGLVRWADRGFLLVTDEFPETLLAFVPFPGSGD